MGLYTNYDHVKDQILLMESLPSLDKAKSMLCRIETQNEVSNAKSLKIGSYSMANFSKGAK